MAPAESKGPQLPTHNFPVANMFSFTGLVALNEASIPCADALPVSAWPRMSLCLQLLSCDNAHDGIAIPN